MVNLNKSPFDDASGQQLVSYLQKQIGLIGMSTVVVPTGTDLDSAAQLTLGLNFIDVVPSGTGVRLPGGAVIGAVSAVVTISADMLLIYPSNANEIVDTGFSPGNPTNDANGLVVFIKKSDTAWIAAYIELL